MPCKKRAIAPLSPPPLETKRKLEAKLRTSPWDGVCDLTKSPFFLAHDSEAIRRFLSHKDQLLVLDGRSFALRAAISPQNATSVRPMN
jgi:hypothetical protein